MLLCYAEDEDELHAERRSLLIITVTLGFLRGELESFISDQFDLFPPFSGRANPVSDLPVLSEQSKLGRAAVP